jgi:hypothetical protein
MREFAEVFVEDDDLLPQVLRELLALATSSDYVDVVHGPKGRVIQVHPDIAEAWYQQQLDTAKTSASLDGEDS